MYVYERSDFSVSFFAFQIYPETIRHALQKKQVEEKTDAGTLVKEVEEEAPIKIIFKRPSRSESEEADIISAVEFSESIRKGILTPEMIQKLDETLADLEHEVDITGIVPFKLDKRYSMTEI